MKRNIVLKSCIASCLIASMAQNVYAEEMGGGVEKSESTHKLDQIVVTATRTEKVLEDVSANMEVITAEDIKNLAAYDVKDALRKAANIGPDLTIRGMDSKGTLILINGRRAIPMNDFPNDVAGFALDRINVNSIERIEIVRGPASVLYGSDAMGGVINIITKRSTESSLFVGTVVRENEINTYATLDTGAMGNWNAIFNARLVNRLSEIEKNTNRDGEEEYSLGSNGLSGFLNVDLGYKFNEDHEILLNVDYSDSSNDRVGGGIDSLSNSSNTRFGTALTYTGNTEKNNFSVTGSYTQTSNTSLVVTPSGKDEESSRVNDFALYGIDAQNTYSLNDMNLLTFGAEYKHTVYDAQTNSDKSSDYFAVYFQDELALLNDSLFITPAVRYDNYTNFGGKFSPKLGATYKINNNSRLKANYGFSFRAPTFDDTHRSEDFPTDDNEHTFVVGNPDLKPEESIGWDITYEGEYKSTSGSITYFSNDVTNLIQGFNTETVSPDGTLYIFERIGNIAEATISGVEAKLGVDFLEYFNLQGEYYYSDSKDTRSGNQVGDIPIHKYIATFTYNDSARGNSAIIWSEWNRKEWTSFRGRGGKFVNHNNLNATVSKTWKDKYTLYLGADNILNEKNEEERYLGDRTWRAGFEMKF